MRIKSVLSWLFPLGVLIVLIFGVTNIQQIMDWWHLRGYQPGENVVNLADETTMKSETRRVFYINHPQLDGKDEFNKQCTSPEQTIVLGCYHSGQNGIFIYNVTDSKLRGILQVTAAHETLHALYERLSSKDKNYVDGLLEQYYKNDLHNQRIKDEITHYQKTEPNAVVDEMHSVFGTEAPNLPPALENYYKRYFEDRSKIVNYSDQYEKAFTDIADQAKSYDLRLSGLKQTIDLQKSRLGTQALAIDEKQREMNTLLARHDASAYNAQVPIYNGMINDYNNLANETRQEISEYNALVNERNALAVQERQLYQEIDSKSINTKSEK